MPADADFGRDDARDMPAHLFRGALRLDYGRAVRADTEQQNCSVCPRHWYVDAIFSCARCSEEFAFTSMEQRVWYEEYRFWVDSLPRHCHACRHALRDLKAIRSEYDGVIEQALQSDDILLKQRVVSLIDQLYELGGELPARIHENRRLLARELAKTQR